MKSNEVFLSIPLIGAWGNSQSLGLTAGSEKIKIWAEANRSGEVRLNGRRIEDILAPLRRRYSTLEQIGVEITAPSEEYLPLSPSVLAAAFSVAGRAAGIPRAEWERVLINVSPVAARVLHQPYGLVLRKRAYSVNGPVLWSVFFKIGERFEGVGPFGHCRQRFVPALLKKARSALHIADVGQLLQTITKDTQYVLAMLIAAGHFPQVIDTLRLIKDWQREGRLVGLSITSSAGFVLFDPAEIELIQDHWGSTEILRPAQGSL